MLHVDGKVLKTKDGTTEVANLADIFNRDGSLITPQDDAAAQKQQKALDAIAKAYGYEGSTDEFLNLYITSAADPKQQLTMQDLLGNMMAGKPQIYFLLMVVRLPWRDAILKELL